MCAVFASLSLLVATPGRNALIRQPRQYKVAAGPVRANNILCTHIVRVALHVSSTVQYSTVLQQGCQVGLSEAKFGHFLNVWLRNFLQFIK